MSHSLPNGVFGPDWRAVSCERCCLTWFAEPDRPPVRNPVVRARPAMAPAPRARSGAIFGVLICGALMATTAYREAIVRRLPFSKSVFALIGLPVNPSGLVLHHVKSVLLTDGPRPVLAVTGEIDNGRDAGRSVPPMRISLRGADGRDIYTWVAMAPKARLGAGETVAFRSRLAAPPDGARDVTVRFADTSD